MLAALCAALAGPRAIAQSITPLLPDAGVLPRSVVRVRQLVTFTRWDDLLGDGGQRNIASILATDSVGIAQLPALAPVEASIRAASGISNFRVTAGNIVAAANSRIMSAPLVIEYGLFSRLTLGVAVPLVMTRTTLEAQLNPARGIANVGANPAQLGVAGAFEQNAAFVNALRDARATLLTRLSDCQANPSGAGCATLLAQATEAQSLAANTEAFASALENLYGTDPQTHPGQPFVPVAQSPVQRVIGDRITAIIQQYQTFLGTQIEGNVVSAAGPLANAGLQDLLQSVGRDTLASTDRTSIGDISVGLTFQLLNSLRANADSTSGGVRYRAAINGTFRIGTGQPANPNRLFDVGTGYGQNGIEGGGALELWLGNRLSLSAVGSYTHQLGTIDVMRVPNAAGSAYPLALPFFGTYSAGDVLQASVSPRIRLAGSLGLTGEYSLIRVGADKYTVGGPLIDIDNVEQIPPTEPFGLAARTAQQIGVGFTYSAAIGRRGPGALPFEVKFNHLETITGSGGPVAKTSRDLIELRVYLNR